MGKDLFELIDQVLVLIFEVVNGGIFILNVPFQLSYLMFVAIDFVIMNIFQLLDLPLSRFLLVFSLAFDKSVVFSLFGLPSAKAFFAFPS